MSDRQGGPGVDSDRNEAPVDVDAVQEVLESHPVKLGVLFGSTVTGEADATSDVDLVVEFDESVERPTDAVLDLMVDLSIALGRNDIDLSVVTDLKPRVGLGAFEHGKVLVGTTSRAEHHRKRFEEQVENPQAESLRRRLDDALDQVDELFEEAG